MTAAAIQVEGLGKRYRIGLREERPDTLMAALAGILRRPLANLARLRSLSRTGSDESGEDLIWALRDVSFEVAEGEVLGIIGRNGAGKSTLLKVLSRITEPTRGRAAIRGRVASLLEVGTGFHPELTGRENVYLNGTILGMTKGEIDAEFDEIVAFSGVERFLDTPVKRYSSGMKVRLAFAVAAHLRASVLLIDEVLAVGDVGFQRKCLGKMDEVASSGRTVLLVSHNMTMVENLCRRSILLHRGRVVEDGQTGAVIDSYLRLTRSDVEQQAGARDLSNRRNPCIEAPPIVTAIRLLDGSGRQGATFRMGEPMTIEVELSGLSGYRGSQVGVTVRSIHGQTLCGINSGMNCRYDSAGRAEREIARLHVPRLPFTPGQYLLEVQAAQKGMQMIDLVPEAARFEVVEADVYGSGYQVSSYFGVFYMDAEWNLRNLVAEVEPEVEAPR